MPTRFPEDRFNTPMNNALDRVRDRIHGYGAVDDRTLAAEEELKRAKHARKEAARHEKRHVVARPPGRIARWRERLADRRAGIR